MTGARFDRNEGLYPMISMHMYVDFGPVIVLYTRVTGAHVVLSEGL